jgi:hypothetical protein
MKMENEKEPFGPTYKVGDIAQVGVSASEKYRGREVEILEIMENGFALCKFTDGLNDTDGVVIAVTNLA